MLRFSSRWFWALLLTLLALLPLAGACDDDEAATTPTPSPARGSGFPVTVTDSAGSRVTFERAPQRIVVLSPGHVEMLFAIGAGGSVVAVDDNSDYPPEAARLPKLSGFQPNLEAIAAARPDLVVIFYDPGDLKISLQRLNIPVLLMGTPDSVKGMLDQMDLLGQVAGRSREASQLRGRLQARIETITQKLRDVQSGPRIFHELDPTLFTTCPGEFIHDMYVTLKAQNIASRAGVPCQLSQEEIIQANPQVIVLADEPAGVTPDSVKARAGWGSIEAVRKNAVHVVDADIFSRPGPRLIDALEQLAKLLYPGRF
ncbi:MAG TPA: ABC transporter substrate-binding protein [Dehalococcoidia bacterium]|nr:ABC transporter substrate-binding protein [Dehalococcoidia bacterium]